MGERKKQELRFFYKKLKLKKQEFIGICGSWPSCGDEGSPPSTCVCVQAHSYTPSLLLAREEAAGLT